MNPILDEILRTREVTTDKGERIPLEHEIPRGEGEFLQDIIRIIKPKKSLEVGLAYGISTLFICETLEEVKADKHIVIDPYQNAWWKGIGIKHLRQAKYQKLIEFIEEPSEIALPGLLKRKERIDFAFVDGWHTFDHTLVDFFYINMMLNGGGVVAFDDADWPSIYKLCCLISRYPCYRICARWPLERRIGTLSRATTTFHYIARRRKKHIRNDLSLFRRRCVAFKKLKEDTRSFDWHEDF